MERWLAEPSSPCYKMNSKSLNRSFFSLPRASFIDDILKKCQLHFFVCLAILSRTYKLSKPRIFSVISHPLPNVFFCVQLLLILSILKKCDGKIAGIVNSRQVATLFYIGTCSIFKHLNAFLTICLRQNMFITSRTYLYLNYFQLKLISNSCLKVLPSKFSPPSRNSYF